MRYLTLYCNNQENKYVQDTNEPTEKGLGEDALHAGRTAKQADSRKGGCQSCHHEQVEQGGELGNAAGGRHHHARGTDTQSLHADRPIQVGSFGAIDRDPGERVISIAYYALVNINEYDRDLVQQHNAFWVNINELPPLVFDHSAMVEKARALMQQKTTTEPIGFNLLPQLFTLSQLQSLYEAIYGENIDKRNFRKRIAEMDYIEKTDKIDKTSSKRGAALYKFNEKAYRKAPKFKI